MIKKHHFVYGILYIGMLLAPDQTCAMHSVCNILSGSFTQYQQFPDKVWQKLVHRDMCEKYAFKE